MSAKQQINIVQGCAKKVPAKFGEESSVKSDGLCIGCQSQWAEVGRENSNMQEFFCTTLYLYSISLLTRRVNISPPLQYCEMTWPIQIIFQMYAAIYYLVYAWYIASSLMNLRLFQTLNIFKKEGIMGSFDIRTRWGYFSRKAAVASSSL